MTAPDAGTAAMQHLLAVVPAETRERLVGLYLDLLGPGLDAVDRRLHGDVGRDAAQWLHKLAGGAGMLQDHDVAQHARAMEAALLAGDPATARASWPALQAAAARSRAVLT